MPRTITRTGRAAAVASPSPIINMEDFNVLFPTDAIEEKKVSKEEVKKKIESIRHIKGFHFYIETTLASPFVDPYSNKPREYFVENESTKERVTLPDALKIGMIGSIYIPTEMYEFIHEYDKNLD